MAVAGSSVPSIRRDLARLESRGLIQIDAGHAPRRIQIGAKLIF